jgi:predicted lipid-binding transport protein (Tim44 family)
LTAGPILPGGGKTRDMAKTETETANDYHMESEMCGLYIGGILGGLVIGSFGDLINSEINAMAFYITGAVLGAIGGAIAGRLFRTIA